MEDLRYKSATVFSHDEIVAELESGDGQRIADALVSAVCYDEDSRWVQNTCLRLLQDGERAVRWSAATCLGDLAFVGKPVEHTKVLAALYLALEDPQIADPVQVSIDLVLTRYPPS